MAEHTAEHDALAKAWDEGYEAGLDHETARAVDPDWPIRTPNPYRVTSPEGTNHG